MAVKHSQDANQRPPKEKVAQQFVKLFYTILNTQPEHLHHFYTDESNLVITEAREESSMPVVLGRNSQQGIGETLASMFIDIEVSVQTVVPQLSLDDSIVLLVTGTMTRKESGETRLFVQALVLARQERGYVIRTDSLHVYSSKTGKSILEETSAQTEGIVYQPSELNGDEDPQGIISMSMEGKKMKSEGTSMTPTVKVAHQPVSPNSACGAKQMTETEATSTAEQDCGSENDASASSTKKSYAQVVLNGVSRSPNPTEDPQIKQGNEQKAAPSVKVQQNSRNQPSSPTSFVPSTPVQKASGCTPSTPPSQESSNKPDTKAPLQPRKPPPDKNQIAQHPECPSDRSIFVCRLPLGITEARVADAFSGYGTLLSGEEGVRVRTGTSACYAFLTYSKPEGAASALASKIEIDGESVVCEVWNPRRKPERRAARGNGYTRARSGRYASRKQASQRESTVAA